MQKIILDVDTGVDDALAIFLASRSPELRVEAITTVVGNVSLAKVVRNTLNVAEMAGLRDVPVYRGASTPIASRPSDAAAVHGGDGLGNSNLPSSKKKPARGFGPDAICEHILKTKGEMILVTTGPLTNLALAIMKCPEVLQKVKLHVMMGGAFARTKFGHGNTTPVAEFNIWHDPEAAKVVFDAGLRTVAVGLDVTTDPNAALKKEHLRGIGTENPAKKLVKRLCQFSIAAGGYLHDPMAVAYVIAPGLFGTEELPVDVELHGKVTRGQTVADPRNKWRKNHFSSTIPSGSARICTSVDGSGFLELFRSRVLE